MMNDLINVGNWHWQQYYLAATFTIAMIANILSVILYALAAMVAKYDSQRYTYFTKSLSALLITSFSVFSFYALYSGGFFK